MKTEKDKEGIPGGGQAYDNDSAGYHDMAGLIGPKVHVGASMANTGRAGEEIIKHLEHRQPLPRGRKDVLRASLLIHPLYKYLSTY